MRKFLCPKCKQLKDKFYQRISVVEHWKVIPHRDYTDAVDFKECLEQETDDIEEAYCECNFSTTDWHSSDFLVEVKGNKIKAIGDYWNTHKDEFEEIANKLGYEKIEFLDR